MAKLVFQFRMSVPFNSARSKVVPRVCRNKWRSKSNFVIDLMQSGTAVPGLHHPDHPLLLIKRTCGWMLPHHAPRGRPRITAPSFTSLRYGTFLTPRSMAGSEASTASNSREVCRVTISVPVTTVSGVRLDTGNVAGDPGIVVLPAMRHQDRLYITFVLTGLNVKQYSRTGVSAALESSDGKLFHPVSHSSTGDDGLFWVNIVFEKLEGSTTQNVLIVAVPQVAPETRIALVEL